MVLKRLIAVTASIALMTTPAMAAGTSSTPAPVAGATSGSLATPAGERVGGMQALGGGRRNFLIIGGAIVFIVLGIWFALQNHENPPASP